MTRLLMSVLKLFYPLFIFAAIAFLGFERTLQLLKLILVALALYSAVQKKVTHFFILLVFVALLYISGNAYQSLLIKSVPALASLWYCYLFLRSLFTSETLIAQFARIKRPTLKPVEERYCFYVTIMWGVFTAMNAILIATLALCTSDYYWALYSGIISYILVGLLFACEYLFRIFVFKKFVIKAGQG